MTWYYMPSTSAPATAASSLPSDSPESLPEPWLTLSGIATQRPLSWRGWKRRTWIERLSGLTSPPSTLARGLAEWISSLPASRANRSAVPVSNEVSMTSDGSGHTLPGSLLTWDRDSCSWRTCPDLFEQVSLTSSPTLPTSGSMRNGDCTPRPRLAHPTNVNASGSWPTPTASDPEGNGFRSGKRSTEPKLAGAAQLFRRPKAWPTPTATDGARLGTLDPEPKNTTLNHAAQNWTTPKAHDAKSGDCRSERERNTPDLPAQASQHHGLPAEMTLTDGVDTSMPVDLNPRFVEALMGVPKGWLTPSTSVETDSYRQWLHGHSLNLHAVPASTCGEVGCESA